MCTPRPAPLLRSIEQTVSELRSLFSPMTTRRTPVDDNRTSHTERTETSLTGGNALPVSGPRPYPSQVIAFGVETSRTGQSNKVLTPPASYPHSSFCVSQTKRITRIRLLAA